MNYMGTREFQVLYPKVLKDKLPVTITRRGSDIAVVLSAEEYNKLNGTGTGGTPNDAGASEEAGVGAETQEA